MKKMKLVLEKGMAESYAMGIRQVALQSLPSWRPIAFSLGRRITYLQAAGDIITSPMTISTDLADCTYTPKFKDIGKDYIVDTVKFKKNLFAKDLTSDNFHVVGKSGAIISALDSEDGSDEEIEFSVVYRLGIAYYTSAQNTTFLKNIGLSPREYLASSSRHTNIVAFTYSIDEISEKEEALTFSLKSDIGNEAEALIAAIAKYRSGVTELHEKALSELKNM